MSDYLEFGVDQQGRNAYAPSTANLKWNALLTTSNATSFFVPTSFTNWIVGFSYQPGTTVWVDVSGSVAVAPSSANLTPCTAELLPGQRKVKAGDRISMITENVTAEVCAVLYAVS